jgi:hypothetical protein
MCLEAVSNRSEPDARGRCEHLLMIAAVVAALTTLLTTIAVAAMISVGGSVGLAAAIVSAPLVITARRFGGSGVVVPVASAALVLTPGVSRGGTPVGAARVISPARHDSSR